MMRTTVVALCLVGMVAAYDLPPANSDGWRATGAREIKYFRQKLSWQDAENNCVAEGGHLMSVHSDDDLHLVYNIDDKNSKWLGGRFTWQDGAPSTLLDFSYTDGTDPLLDIQPYAGVSPFDANEPNNNYLNQDCLASVVDNPPVSDPDHSLRDVRCDDPVRAYICARDRTTTTTEPPTTVVTTTAPVTTTEPETTTPDTTTEPATTTPDTTTEPATTTLDTTTEPATTTPGTTTEPETTTPGTTTEPATTTPGTTTEPATTTPGTTTEPATTTPGTTTEPATTTPGTTTEPATTPLGTTTEPATTTPGTTTEPVTDTTTFPDPVCVTTSDCNAGSECVAGYCINCVARPADCNIIEKCDPNPCMNGGTCVSDGVNFACNCIFGYTDRLCETEVDLCKSCPCHNGATCTPKLGGYECTCPEGWEGDDCDVNTNDCEPNPCENGGVCVDGMTDFSCKCPDGYFGKKCEINHCEPNPCQNGGTCTGALGGYVCACTTCTVYDPDTGNGARNNARESPAWVGCDCEIDYDECQSNPCQNGGTCVHNKGEPCQFACNCDDDHWGNLCERKFIKN